MTSSMFAFRVLYIVRSAERTSYYASRTVHIVCDNWQDASSITLDEIGVYETSPGTQWYPLEILYYGMLTEDDNSWRANENIEIGEPVPFGEALD